MSYHSDIAADIAAAVCSVCGGDGARPAYNAERAIEAVLCAACLPAYRRRTVFAAVQASDTPRIMCAIEREEAAPMNEPVIVNVTPHALTLQSQGGEVHAVDPSGVVISATPVEVTAGRHPSGAELVRTTFVASPEAEARLAALELEHPGAMIVGSIIAAQAFPGRVLALVPAPGFERSKPEDRRMRDDKFTTF